MILRGITRPLVWFIIAASFPALPAQSFIFASPNTREHMTDEDALASLGSFEEKNFVAVSQYLGARICAKPKVQQSEGLDGPGAENSVLITGCVQQSATYLAELLGRYAHQKSVLVFSPATNGTDRLWILTVSSQQPGDALRRLRQHGFAAATVMGENRNVRILIWVQDHTQDPQIHALASDTHAEIQEVTGRGTLIGNNDRAEAQRIFDREITAYERRRKAKFSQLLWSRKLRDMGLRSK